MMTILAQGTDLPGVPASFWKEFSICLLILLGVLVALVVIWSSLKKPAPIKISDDPAVEVRKASKRYNHDLSEERHSDHERRLNALETWQIGLISKMDADKNEILKAGDDRRDALQLQINELPSKIVADMLNTQKLLNR